MDVTEILKNLNESQEQAVISDNQHLLVLAGAGSGKTRVLVHRICLLYTSPSPRDRQKSRMASSA